MTKEKDVLESQTYDLMGLKVHVVGDQGRRVCGMVWQSFFADCERAEWELDIQFDNHPKPIALKPFHRSQYTLRIEQIIYLTIDSITIELPGYGRLELCENRRRATFTLHRDNVPVNILEYFLIQFLAMGQQSKGAIALHAASLAINAEDADFEEAIVLIAPSNTGKTTTTLALACDSLRLTGDDLVFVRRSQGGRFEAWGYPRCCHLRPNTLKLLPWTESLPFLNADAEGVRTIAIDQLGRRASLVNAWRPLRGLIGLSKPDGETATCEMISPAKMLMLLAQESVQPTYGIYDCAAIDRFKLIGELARQSSSWELRPAFGRTDDLQAVVLRQLHCSYSDQEANVQAEDHTYVGV